MKKILYCTLAAAGVMSLASCSNDDMPMPTGDGVNITVKLPRDMATRGTFGDGTDTGDRAVLNNLQWSVFEVSGETKTLVFSDGRGAFGTSQTEELVNIPLAKGKTYQIAFYADDSSNGFVTYSDGDITVDYAKAASNTAAEDAFIGKSTVFTVSGAYSETVTLTRPFAQLNWGTDDTKAKVLEGIIEKMTASVKVTDGLFKNMNVLSGIATNPVSGDVAFNAVNLSKLPTQAFPVKKTDATQEPYALIAMNYLLTGNGVIDCELTLNEGLAPVVVNAAPVQVNHRTNIYGSLLTAPGEFNIIVDNNFQDPDNNVEVTKVSTAEDAAAAIAAGGNVEISAPLDLIDLTASTPAKPLVLTLSSPVKQIKLGTSEENPQPTTIVVAKDVAYPEFLFPGSKDNNAIRNLTITGDLTSSERCPGFDAQGTQTNPGVKTIDGLTFENVPFTGAGVSVAFTANPQTTRNIVVRNCDFADLKKPAFSVQSNGYAGDNIGNIVIENNKIAFAADAVKTSNGIYVLSTTGGTVSIKNNTLSDGPYHGLMLGNNKADITAEGNVITGFAEDGIKMDQPAAKVNILNNTVQAKQYGIRVARFVTANNPTITITGNKVDMSICESSILFNGIYLGYSSENDSPATIIVKDNIKAGGDCKTWFKILSNIVPSADSDYETPFSE